MVECIRGRALSRGRPSPIGRDFCGRAAFVAIGAAVVVTCVVVVVVFVVRVAVLPHDAGDGGDGDDYV